jgi:hypothetical protein
VKDRSNPQCVFQVLIDLHDGSLVTASVAVVGGCSWLDAICSSRRSQEVLTGEYGDHVPVLRPVVPLHHKLVSSGNQRQTVVVVESLGYILAKSVAGATWRDSPSAPVVRIGPQQVAHGALVGHLLDSVKGANIIERIDARGEAAVQAEDLVVDERRKGQVVEEVGEVFPHVGIAVLAEALIVEAIHLCDLTRLVVATQDGDALGIADLESDEQSHGLDGIVASVDVVA